MFDSLHGEVREVCPKTGDYIELKEIPPRLVVYHFLKTNKRPPNYLGLMRRKMVEKGFKALTKKEIERCHKTIKKITKRFDS